MREPLNLAFKGNRDYVQGPDIYSAVVGTLALEPQSSFRLVIHHFARRQCELVISAASDAAPADAVALFWTTRAGLPLQGWVVEREAEITSRAPYDEEPIWSRSERSGKELRMTSAPPVGYAAVEVLVSLTKRLHLDALPESPTKWVFTQLNVSRLLAEGDIATLRVHLDQALGTRFTKSSVFVGAELVGSIHFAGVRRA
jgi:hypothetical protein